MTRSLQETNWSTRKLPSFYSIVTITRASKTSIMFNWIELSKLQWEGQFRLLQDTNEERNGSNVIKVTTTLNTMEFFLLKCAMCHHLVWKRCFAFLFSLFGCQLKEPKSEIPFDYYLLSEAAKCKNYEMHIQRMEHTGANERSVMV